MKKLITILIVVALVTTTLATTATVSAKDDRDVLYEEALIQDTPDGPVIRGEVKIYGGGYEATVDIQNPDSPGATYTIRIAYGWALSPVVVTLGEMTLDENGNCEKSFILTGLDDSPPPPGMDPPPFEAPRRIVLPAFYAIQPGVPQSLMFTGFVLPSQVVWKDLVKTGTDPEWVVAGKVLHKIVAGYTGPPEALIVEVRMLSGEPNTSYGIGVSVHYTPPPYPSPPNPDASNYWGYKFETDGDGKGVARVTLPISPPAGNDRIWAVVTVQEEPYQGPGDLAEYFNRPPPTEIPY